MAPDQPPHRSHPVRNVVLIAMLAFLLGICASAWLIMNPERARALFSARNAAVTAPVLAVPAVPTQALASPVTSAAAPITDIAQRITGLEDRLSRIDQSAAAASDNAKRAEGLLLAFAARRALDRGLALGYVEGQLSAHFGAQQPRAVAMILAASRDPVTVDQLKTELETLAPLLTEKAANPGWWETVQDAVGSLFIVRKSGDVSPIPVDRLARALQMVEIERVDLALADVARLPGRDNARVWIEKARRYIEANRALDLLEAAAIMTASEQTQPAPGPVLE